MTDEESAAEVKQAFNDALDEACLQYQQGNTQAALSATRLALRARPGDALAQHLMGLVFFAEGEYHLAFEIFEALIQRMDGEVVLRVNAGLAGLLCGQLEEGMNHLQYAISLDSGHQRSFGYLALAHLESQDLELVAAALMEAGLGELAGQMADGDLSRHDLVEALATLEPAEDVAPNEGFVEVQMPGWIAGAAEVAAETQDVDEDASAAEIVQQVDLLDAGLPGTSGEHLRPPLDLLDETPRQLMVSGEIITDAAAAGGGKQASREPISSSGLWAAVAADSTAGASSVEQTVDEALELLEERPLEIPRKAVDPASLAQRVKSREQEISSEALEDDESPSVSEVTAVAQAVPLAAPFAMGHAGDVTPLVAELASTALPMPALSEVAVGASFEVSEPLAALRFGAWVGEGHEDEGAVVREDHLLAVQGRLVVSSVCRRSRGADGRAFLVDHVPLVALEGDGVAVIRAPDGANLRLISLTAGESLYLRQEAVCAFSRSVHYENGELPGRGTAKLVRFSGEGHVLVRGGDLRSLPVRLTAPATVRASALLGWHGDVVVCPARGTQAHLSCEGTGTALLRI